MINHLFHPFKVLPEFAYTTMIQITANGETHQIQPSTPLPDFVESVGLALERVVVEHNGQALTRTEARGIELQNGDRLEIVRIVAGG